MVVKQGGQHSHSIYYCDLKTGPNIRWLNHLITRHKYILFSNGSGDGVSRYRILTVLLHGPYVTEVAWLNMSRGLDFGTLVAKLLRPSLVRVPISGS
jgi:hypothetical protein